MLNLQKFQDKRVFYILVFTLVILFVLFLTLLSRQQKVQEELALQNQQVEELMGTPPTSTSPLPQTVFSDYALNTDFPSLPASVKMSDLKTTYTTGEALDLATKVGFSNAIVDDGVNMIMVTDDADGLQSALFISKTTGSVMLVTESGFPTGGSDPESAARSFLSKLGLLDDTLVASATYVRASSPGVTFVEFHRSWEKLGLPLLNPVGTLNLSENESLADVRLGYIEESAPEDPDVIDSSDGQPGKVRPNQFNTITVGVLDENNNVTSVASNIKVFSNTQTKASSQTLKTPEEALEDLRNGKTSFSLTKPLGEGIVDFNTVYTDGQAVSDNAVINEIVLTYLDEVGQKTQSSLYPHYLFRGVATLASGYQVQFVQTVPAVKQINTLGLFAQNSAPIVFPGQSSTLQYGTFNWLSPVPNAQSAVACEGLTQIFALPDGGYIGWYPNTQPRNWYYVPSPGEVIDQTRFLELKKVIRWEAAKACKASQIDPTVCSYADTGVDIQTACTYLGSTSPYLYFYTDSSKQFQVKLSDFTTYVDPIMTSKKNWEFTVLPAQTLNFANGVTRNKLYYEYNIEALNSVSESLITSEQGFLVEKTELAAFVAEAASRVGLNSNEEADLLLELTKEANKLGGERLKIGLIEQETLDKLLPVTITPKVNSFSRVVFYLTTASGKEKMIEPTLPKVERGGDTVVVEVGAVAL